MDVLNGHTTYSRQLNSINFQWDAVNNDTDVKNDDAPRPPNSKPTAPRVIFPQSKKSIITSTTTLTKNSKPVKLAVIKKEKAEDVPKNDNNETTSPSQTSRRRIRKPSRKYQEASNALSELNHMLVNESDDFFTDKKEDVAYESQWPTDKSDYLKNRLRDPVVVKRPNGTANKIFPEILFDMVQETSVSQPHIVEWLPCGSAFKVKDTVSILE